LKRSGEGSVWRTVCWMFLCPRWACKARVGHCSLRRLQPQQPLLCADHQRCRHGLRLDLTQDRYQTPRHIQMGCQ
jgi:hypothetical protein